MYTQPPSIWAPMRSLNQSTTATHHCTRPCLAHQTSSTKYNPGAPRSPVPAAGPARRGHGPLQFSSANRCATTHTLAGPWRVRDLGPKPSDACTPRRPVTPGPLLGTRTISRALSARWARARQATPAHAHARRPRAARAQPEHRARTGAPPGSRAHGADGVWHSSMSVGCCLSRPPAPVRTAPVLFVVAARGLPGPAGALNPSLGPRSPVGSQTLPAKGARALMLAHAASSPIATIAPYSKCTQVQIACVGLEPLLTSQILIAVHLAVPNPPLFIHLSKLHNTDAQRPSATSEPIAPDAQQNTRKMWASIFSKL